MEHYFPSEIDFDPLYLIGWIRAWDPRCLRERQKRIYFFKRIASPPIDIELIEHWEPMMHDVDIEDLIKANHQF